MSSLPKVTWNAAYKMYILIQIQVLVLAYISLSFELNHCRGKNLPVQWLFQFQAFFTII